MNEDRRRIQYLEDRLNALENLLTAKGSLWAASAQYTAGGLAVGANDTTLVADSAQSLGVKWQALASWTALTEAAQDAVGAMLVDSARIDLTYTDATPALTADIIADSVSNTYLANMAQYTVKGRVSSGAGDPEDLTAAQLNTVIETTNGPWHAHRMSVDTGTRTIADGYSLVVPQFEIPSGTVLEIASGGILMTIG